MKNPKRIAKKINPNIWPSAAAFMMFGGTMRIKIPATSPTPLPSISCYIFVASVLFRASNSPAGSPSTYPGATKLIRVNPISMASKVVAA